MKKRIISVILGLALSFSFVACGNESTKSDATDTAEVEEETVENGKTEESDETEEGENTADEKTKLTGLCWGATDNNEKMTELLFEAKPELRDKYEIEWVVGGKTDDDIAEKMRLALSANEPIADFIQLNYTQIPEFAEAGVFADTSTYIEKYKDSLLEGALTVSQYKGEYVAFPFELKPRVWFYRSDLFEEAGVDVESIKTTDDLIEAGKKVQEIYPDTYIWNLGKDAPAYDFYLTLSGNGARFSDDDGNYIINEDAGVRDMLVDYKKMVDAGVVLNVSDWTTDWEQVLNDGTVISQLSAGWLAQGSFLPTYASGQEGNWKATTWPEIAGSNGGSDAGGSVFVIPSFAENPEAAGEFLSEFTLSKEGSKAIFDIIASTPVNRDTLEMPEVKEPNTFFGESLYQAQIKALDELKIFNYSPKANAEATIVTEYFIKAIYGEMTIDEALDGAQKDLETMIGNAYD